LPKPHTFLSETTGSISSYMALPRIPQESFDVIKINIKKCKALLKKVVIGRAVTALKQQKSKGKGE
jgi:hypothetical protein